LQIADCKLQIGHWESAICNLQFAICSSHSIAACVLLAAAVSAQDARPARESVTLDAPLIVAKRMATVRDFLSLEEWDAGIDALDGLLRESPDALVEVATGRYQSVRRYGQSLLAGLPPEGLRRYRERVDSQARQWLEAAVRGRDDALLKRLISEAFASSAGDDALWQLAEWAWEDGDLDAARAWWTQLLPLDQTDGEEPPAGVLRYPDAAFDAPAVRARLVLCSVMRGDFSRAARELDSFRRLHPQAVGTLAGREGNLAEILDAVAGEARAWSDPQGGLGAPTFARRPARNDVAFRAPDLAPARWSVPLAPARVPLAERVRPALRDAGPLAYHPLAWRNLVLLNDAETVRVLRLDDGRPAWPTGDPRDQGVIYTVGAPAAVDLGLPAIGVPRFTATISGGRYYARMGPPVITSATRGLKTPDCRLICLDLAVGEGRLVWSVTPGEAFGAADWTFGGGPLVIGERLFVPLRRAIPQIEIGVACFDTLGGELLWQRGVYGTLQQSLPALHLVGHDLLTSANGRLFVGTDSGAVAALDAETGRTEWVTTYPSRPQSAAELSDPARSGLLPPVYAAGTLFIAPNDSRSVRALDAASGVVLWERPAPGRIVNLLGVDRGVLVAAGDKLWRLDADTGRVLPPAVGFDDPDGHGYGRGVIADGLIYWPTREELFVVDLDSGEIVRRVPLRMLHNLSGGNLVSADGTLLVAGPDRLTAIGR
jgi:outer membrane protein assembly factor BamB